MRGKSQPTPGALMQRIRCHVEERFSRNLALIISTRPPTDFSLARVPESLVCSRGRRNARDQTLIMRA